MLEDLWWWVKFFLTMPGRLATEFFGLPITGYFIGVYLKFRGAPGLLPWDVFISCFMLGLILPILEFQHTIPKEPVKR